MTLNLADLLPLRKLGRIQITMISRAEFELRSGGWISPDQVAAAREAGARPHEVATHLEGARD